MTVTLETQNETEESAEGAAAPAAAAGPGAAGQSLLGQSRTSAEVEDLGDAAAQSAGNPPAPLSWARYVIGLDQAIESIRKEADKRLLQEQQPAKAKQADTTQLDPADTARPADTTTFLDQGVSRDGRGFKAEKDRFEAIDVTIGSWGLAETAPLQSLIPINPGTAASEPSTLVPRFVEIKDQASLVPSVDGEHAQLVENPGSRLAKLVAISAMAAMAQESLWKRSISPVVAGASPTRQSPWECLNRNRSHPRKAGRLRSFLAAASPGGTRGSSPSSS